MKVYRMYVCEKFGFESKNSFDVELCEARHLGLNTLEEKRAYDELKRHAEYCGWDVTTEDNDITRTAFDKAIADLIKFEKEHNMAV